MLEKGEGKLDRKHGGPGQIIAEWGGQKFECNKIGIFLQQAARKLITFLGKK